MHLTRRVILGAVAVAALGIGTATAAQADPINAKNSFLLTVTCSNGVTYQAATNGNGHWTPAHDVAGNTVLVPLAFPVETFTVLDPAGNIIDQQTAPPRAKSAVDSNKNADLTCTFVGSTPQPDGTTFVLSGTVIGFATPNS
jgi:hypothetical protein